MAFLRFSDKAIFEKFDMVPEFNTDLNRLVKKYSTIKDDFETLKLVLGLGIDAHSDSRRIGDLGDNIQTQNVHIMKARKVRCKSLHSNEIIRVIYAKLPEEKRLVFIEMYPKVSKEKENRDRIKKHFKDYPNNLVIA